MERVAVIGAGLCGAAAAAKLVQSGYQVSVFDKGRAVGGRMSSKRTAAGYLDMGAQYFTARDARFQSQVESWLNAGCVAAWNCTTALLTYDEGRCVVEMSADQQHRYIGKPSMQAPVKALLADIPVTTNCRITSLQRHQLSWSVLGENGESHTGFAAVLLTMPPAQAQQLLVDSGFGELYIAQDALLEPCWAVAVRAAARAKYDAIFCEHPKLRFISHQGTKTGRSGCYILHFNAAFSRENLGQPAEFWLEQAIDIVHSVLGSGEEIEAVTAHRWLYASQNPEQAPAGIVAFPDMQLWLGGDWSYGGRVENAYLAGLDLAGAFISHCNTTAEN